MADTRQKLLHLRSAEVKTPVATALGHGEIAVQYANTEPALYIKKADNSIAKFVDKAAVESLINAASGAVSASFTGQIEALDASVTGSVADVLTVIVGQENGKLTGVTVTAGDNLTDAITKRHNHNNKTVLDGITSDKVTAWDNAATNKHTHDNKALLDTYTQTEANLAEAVAKKHEHANKTVLDGIEADDITAWNAKIKSVSMEENDYITVTTNDTKDVTITQAFGTAAKKTALVGDIAGATASTVQDNLVSVAQVKAYTAGLTGAMHFRGVFTATTACPTPQNGDVILVDKKEYVYSDNAWVEFGDEGAYELKGTALDEIKKLDAVITSDDAAAVTVKVEEIDGKITDVVVTNTTAYTTMAAKAHEHTNKTVLDGIEADDITAWNAKVGSVTSGAANGTIKVDGNDVNVTGLKSAAYTLSTDYLKSEIATGKESGVVVTADQKLDFSSLIIDCGTY